MLENLGLDTDAAAVYKTMLTHRAAGVTEIAAALGYPEARVRDALNRLADLALLRPSLEAPGELRPVSPELGLALLLQRQQSELLEVQRRFSQSQAAVSDLISDFTTARQAAVPGEAERLDGLDAVQARLEELAHRTAAECLSFMPGGAQSSSSLAASRPLDELLLRRGARVLTVYLDSVRNDPATLAYARWLTRAGGAVRTTPSLPLRMVVFDRTVGLVPIDPDDTRRGAVQLTGPGILAALVTVFEQAWQAAAPLGEAPPAGGEGGEGGEPELTGQERELLRLLSQGLTDEAAARRLGISLRTTRRMMAAIMARLGAHSRFEAGLRARERRWIPP